MNRLSLVRYTSAVALGLSTLWSAAVCAAEDAGAFDKIQQIRAGDLNIALVAPSCSSSLSAWAFCSVVYFFMVPAPVGFSPVLKRHALKMAGVFGGYTAFVRAWSCGWVFLWLRRLEWLWCVLVKGEGAAVAALLVGVSASVRGGT